MSITGWKPHCRFSSKIFLPPPTKLWGGNVFSRVCLFTGRGEGVPCDHCGPVQTCSLGHPRLWPQDLFKVVHLVTPYPKPALASAPWTGSNSFTRDPLDLFEPVHLGTPPPPDFNSYIVHMFVCYLNIIANIPGKFGKK